MGLFGSTSDVAAADVCLMLWLRNHQNVVWESLSAGQLQSWRVEYAELKVRLDAHVALLRSECGLVGDAELVATTQEMFDSEELHPFVTWVEGGVFHISGDDVTSPDALTE